MKDKWAQGKALEYMRAHPATTLRRAAIKFGDFWGLDRSFIAGVQQGLYRPPAWFGIVGAIASLAACAALLLAAAIGLWLAAPPWRVHVLLLLPIVLVTGIHTIVFGHPRYHDPLVPLLAVAYAFYVHNFFLLPRAKAMAQPLPQPAPALADRDDPAAHI
jgi:hypothetical protein